MLEKGQPQRFNAYNSPHEDLREFIKRAEEAGEIVRIKGADWKLEMGTLGEIVNHARPEPPALLFEDVPGYPKGMRLISGATNSSKRLAITLGLPVPSCPLDVVRAYRDRMKEHRPIPPKTVGKGAVFENVDRDDEVDLLEVPGAVPARARRRPLHRHRRHRDHARPGRELGQLRHLSRHGAGQEPRLDLDLARQARPADPREILQGRQALPGADLMRARSAACSSPAATS